MSGIATAIVGGAALIGGATYLGSKSTAGAATQAADVQAGAQRESLEYLKETEAVPQALREEALLKLGGLYGLESGEGDQQELIDQSINSPLYQSIMGGKEAGEDAILRSASATGGLRSGDTSYNLYDYNVRLQNQALLSSYNDQLMGLQGLGQLPSNANQIASSMAGIGQTQAQGITAAGQIQATGIQQGMGNVMGMGQLGIAAYGAGMFSDRRLKTNIKKIGEVKGFNFYSFDWNSVANMLGLKGSTYGCMADEVFKTVPEAVTLKNNFMFINYKMIGVL